MTDDGKREMFDVMATGATAVNLLGFGLWNFMTISRIPHLLDMFSEMDMAGLPVLSRLVFQAAEIYILHAMSLVILLTGFALLFVTKDRLRGLIYGLTFSLLLGVVTLVIRELSWLPMIKVMQSML